MALYQTRWTREKALSEHYLYGVMETPYRSVAERLIAEAKADPINRTCDICRLWEVYAQKLRMAEQRRQQSGKGGAP